MAVAGGAEFKVFSAAAHAIHRNGQCQEVGGGAGQLIPKAEQPAAAP
ncbi:hypothetical protein [Arthrobacter sp. SD76]